MLSKLKDRIFPCEKLMKRLMESHAESVRQNNEAHTKLLNACNERSCPVEKGGKPEKFQDIFFANTNTVRVR